MLQAQTKVREINEHRETVEDVKKMTGMSLRAYKLQEKL